MSGTISHCHQQPGDGLKVKRKPEMKENFYAIRLIADKIREKETAS